MKPAVVLMAYGSPSDLADIRPYLEDIRSGRPVSDEAVEELTERYRRIGGRSPLDDVTEGTRAGLERELGFPVALKASVPRLVHKTDVGGVALQLATAAAVTAAALAMRARFPTLEGYVVQRQVRRDLAAVHQPFGAAADAGAQGVDDDLACGWPRRGQLPDLHAARRGMKQRTGGHVAHLPASYPHKTDGCGTGRLAASTS